MNLYFKKNGKLNKRGKQQLREMREDFFSQFPDGWIVYPLGGAARDVIEVGCSVSDDGIVKEVARAVCHPNDKYRRKVGEFVALSRFFEGKTALETFY